jgi:hypothetical protein
MSRFILFSGVDRELEPGAVQQSFQLHSLDNAEQYAE